MLAVFFLQYVELVRSKFRGAVMRVFRDRRADSDRSLRLGWTIFVWLMTRQLVSDVDLVEQAELDRLEGLPPCLPGHGLSYGTCDVSVDHVFGDQVPIFVDVATLPPTGVVMAAAALSERAVPRLASPAMSAKVGRVRGPSVTEKRRMEEEVALAARKEKKRSREKKAEAASPTVRRTRKAESPQADVCEGGGCCGGGMRFRLPPQAGNRGSSPTASQEASLQLAAQAGLEVEVDAMEPGTAAISERRRWRRRRRRR